MKKLSIPPFPPQGVAPTLLRLIHLLCFAPLLALVWALPAAAQEEDPVQEASQALEEYRPDLDRDATVALAKRLEELETQLSPARHDSLRSRLLEIAGLLSFRHGELEHARALWERGLQAARDANSPQQIMSLLNMNAVGVSQAGDFERGIELFHELTLLRHEHGDRRGEGIAWNNIANANMQLNRLPEATAAVDSAKACFEEVGFARGLGNVYVLRGLTLLEMRRSEEALASFDAAAEVARELQQKDLIATALANRGRVKMLRGEPYELALADVDSAIALWQEMDNRHQLLMVRMIRGEVLVETGHGKEGLDLLRAVLAQRNAAGEDFDALPVRNLIGAAYLEQNRLEEARNYLQETLTLLEEMRALTKDERTRIGIYRRGGLAHRDLADVLIREGKIEEAWAVAERGRAWLLREQLTPTGGAAAIIELATLQARLADTGAVYVHLSERLAGSSFAFVIDGENLEVVRISVPHELMADLEMAIYQMANGSPDELCDPPLSRLGAALIQPLIPYLPEDGRGVLFSLPSNLSDLPLDALLYEADGTERVFGEHYATSLVPSATTWDDLEERVAPSEGVFAFADPTPRVAAEEVGAVTRFRDVLALPLPQAREEARAVTRRGGRQLVGEEASKLQFLDLIERDPGVLHFATHAVVDPVYPEQSALLLAGGEEDRLTAGEIESHPFHTDLVTLSGCRTGGGLMYIGEGTLGLMRSFFVAGARSVVMSRWDVEDTAARRFMEVFYAELEKGEDRAVAMKTTRARLHREGFPHRDRSAFVLAGVATEPVASLLNRKEPGSLQTRLLIIAALILLSGSLLRQIRHRRSGAAGS
jgi:CHAT domain-containing protein